MYLVIITAFSTVVNQSTSAHTAPPSLLLRGLILFTLCAVVGQTIVVCIYY